MPTDCLGVVRLLFFIFASLGRTERRVPGKLAWPLFLFDLRKQAATTPTVPLNSYLVLLTSVHENR